MRTDNLALEATKNATSGKNPFIEDIDVEHQILPSHGQDDSKPTTYAETFANMIKGNIGCGLLAMGAAYKHGGLLVSTILVLVIGSVSLYNQYTLVTMANVFQQKYKCNRMSFSNTIKFAFERGPLVTQKLAGFTRWTIEMFIILTQLGFCTVYFMFVSKSMSQILRNYDIFISETTLMTVVLPIFWLTSLIRELKYIAPLSTLANISTLASLGLILYFSTSDLPSVTDRKLMGEWSDIPLCFGTVVYALEGISLVLPLQQNMKKKDRFLGPFGVLNMSILMVVMLMMSIGFFGYLKHGENVADTLTLNLDSKNILTQVVIGCMVLGILFTYTLQFYIPVLLLLPWVRRNTYSWPGSEWHVYDYILRSFLVLLTYFVARLIPHFDLFISLIGAVGSSFLALIYSPLADLSWREDKGFLGWRVLLNLTSLLIGFSGFFVGTTTSLRDIMRAIYNDNAQSF